jgi:hypothetical protein
MQIYDALKIAVQYLEDHGMLYRQEYQVRASRVDKEWSFWFIFQPATPGLDVTVFVSDNGQSRVSVGF